MKKLILTVVLVAVAGFVMAESKYSASTSAATAVTFKAKDNGWNVKAVLAKSGTSDSVVNIYGRAQEALDVQAVSARSAATCTVVNTGLAITTNDLVVYQSANGTAEYRTVSTASATSLVLSSAPSTTYASGDKIYELGQIGAVDLGATNATTSKASANVTGASIAKTPNDSPLYVVTSGTTNNVLTVTAE